MLITPFFLRPPKQRWCSTTSGEFENGSGLPIMVYNVPLLTGTTDYTFKKSKCFSMRDVVHSVKMVAFGGQLGFTILDFCVVQTSRIFAGIDVIAFEAMGRWGGRMD